jgi:hypothetical protein
MIFVIGNGKSRLGFDLNTLNNYPTIGCNALYTEYSPTYLLAVDNVMIEEIKNSTYSGNVYTPCSLKVDKNNFYKYNTKFRTKPYSSGAYALDLAGSLEYKKVIMLGFDNLPKKHYKESTIYPNHPIYKRRNGRWAHELFEKDYCAAMKYWKDVEFVNVIHPTLSNPMQNTLGTLSNYSTITYEALVAQWT